MRRARKSITYHGRKGRPVVHVGKQGRHYIMVRAKGGGTKVLYVGTIYRTTPTGQRPAKWKRLTLGR